MHITKYYSLEQLTTATINVMGIARRTH